MGLNKEVKMNTIFLGVGTLAFLAGVIIFIVVMIELKKTIKGLKELIQTTERSIKPTLIELQETLRSFRYFTDNMNETAENIRDFTGSIREVGESIRNVNENVKQVNALIGSLQTMGKAEISGIKAGIGAGLRSIARNLVRGEPGHTKNPY